MGEASVSFTAPLSDGGKPIYEYTVYAHGRAYAKGASSPIPVTGLPHGVENIFTVSATNIVGEGRQSEGSNAIVFSASVGNLAATLEDVSLFTTTALVGSGEGIVDAFLGGATIAALGKLPIVSRNDIILGDVTLATSTKLTITAAVSLALAGDRTDLAGFLGLGSTVAVTTDDATLASTLGTRPDAPTIGTATAGNGAADVTFTLPAGDGGSPITGHTATSTPGGLTGTAPAGATKITVGSLVNGTSYTFNVVSHNDIGTSLPSAESNAVTPEATQVFAPGAPTIGTASRSASQTVQVTCTAPTSDGGAPITEYVATSTPGGLTGSSSTTTILVGGLIDGQAYTFTVHAVNSAGPGPESAASNSATPADVPSVPGVPFVTTDASGEATIWVGYPKTDGGSPITGFRFTASPGGAVVNRTFAQVNAEPTKFGGLVNGTEYSFTAVAINEWGDSVASASSNKVMPSASGSGDGPFDALYDPGFTAVTGTDFVASPTLAWPPQSTGQANPSYTDPSFGTKVFRPFDTTTLPQSSFTKLRHKYSRSCPFNLDGTMMIIIGSGARYQVFRTADWVRLPSNRDDGAVGDVSFSPQDRHDVWWSNVPGEENKIYFTTDTLRFYVYDVSTKTVSLYRNLETRLGSTFGAHTHVTTGGEGRPSDDGRYLCLMVKDGSTHKGYMTYDIFNDVITGKMPTSHSEYANNTTMSSKGNYGVLGKSGDGVSTLTQCRNSSTVKGVRAYTRDFTSFNQLSDSAGHHDVCIDADGDEAYYGFASSTRFDEEGVSVRDFWVRKCAGGLPTVLYNRKVGGTCTQWHASGCAAPGRPGWILISTYHEEDPSAETGWTDNKLFMLKLGLPFEARFVAHHRMASKITLDYWDEPHASISRDGLQPIWSLRWRETTDGPYMHTKQESYVVGLPSWFYGDTAGGGGDNQWGNNLVDNGSFTTGMAPWSVAAGTWTWLSAGTTMEVSAPSSVLTQTGSFVPGSTYRVTFDVFGYSATGAGIRAQLAGTGASVLGVFLAGDGPQTVNLVAVDGNNAVQFESSSDFSGSARINNVVVIGPENLTINGHFTDGTTGWNTNSQWVIANGVATKSSPEGGNMWQDFVFEAGKTYAITYTIKSISGSSMAPRLINGTASGTVFGTQRSVPGTYTDQLVAGDHTAYAFNGAPATDCVIDDISMTKVS